MKRAARKTTRPSVAAPAGPTPLVPAEWLSRADAILMASAVALIVATPLIASEGAVPRSTHVVLVMGWLLLTAAWLVQSLLRPRPVWHLGPAGGALLAFLCLHSLSAVVRLQAGHARLTLNALWLWVSLGLLFLAIRQLARSEIQQRAVCGVLLALAAGLAAIGFYQVGYSNPKLRAEFANNPDEMLRREGEYAPPGSPQREHVENRVASLEPIGPFALTNSLAGFLAPCLVLLVGLAVPIQRVIMHRPLGWFGIGLLILMVAGCLLLTKSRAAYLAVAAGLCLLTLMKVTSVTWRHWKGIAAAAAGLAMIAGVFVAFGGLDRQVLTEAPKSFLYRVEYWRATGSMIAQHPWFGCGPGNFQEFYTQHKLPEASETVADPHNFLLEVAATAGLPALCVFLLVGVAVLWQLRPYLADEVDRSDAHGPAKGSAPADAGRRQWVPIYAGVGIGILLAFPAGWAGDMPVNPEILWVMPLAAGTTLWFLHPWVIGGTLTCGPLLVAAATLLVNLSAAGGIAFPGVAEVLWILLALALTVAETGRSQHTPAPYGLTFGKRGLTVGLAGSLLLALLSYLSMYRPVLAAREPFAQALTTTNANESLKKCLVAAQADPWWAEPCELYAELLCRQWMADPSDARLQEFDQALAAWLQRDRHSSLLYRRCGDWLILMYASSGRQDLLPRAIDAHSQAVRLYPNSNVLRHSWRGTISWLATTPVRRGRQLKHCGLMDCCHMRSLS